MFEVDGQLWCYVQSRIPRRRLKTVAERRWIETGHVLWKDILKKNIGNGGETKLFESHQEICVTLDVTQFDPIITNYIFIPSHTAKNFQKIRYVCKEAKRRAPWQEEHHAYYHVPLEALWKNIKTNLHVLVRLQPIWLKRGHRWSSMLPSKEVSSGSRWRVEALKRSEKRKRIWLLMLLFRTEPQKITCGILEWKCWMALMIANSKSFLKYPKTFQQWRLSLYLWHFP